MIYWHNTRTACGAWSMQLSGVRLSVRLSVPSGRHTPLLQVCCCGPGGQDTSKDCCSGGGRIRAVPRCQRTYPAERRLVSTSSSRALDPRNHNSVEKLSNKILTCPNHILRTLLHSFGLLHKIAVLEIDLTIDSYLTAFLE